MHAGWIQDIVQAARLVEPVNQNLSMSPFARFPKAGTGPFLTRGAVRVRPEPRMQAGSATWWRAASSA